MAEYPVSTSRRRAGVVTAWILAGFLAVLVLGAAWVGVRAVLAYGHLSDARASAADAADALADPARAAAVVDRLSRDTSAARSLTSDPVWTLAEGLPWIGTQLRAISTITAAADDVATDALAPLAEVAGSFSANSLRPQDGRIDVSVLAALQEPAAASAQNLADAAARVDRIRPDTLLGPLRAPVAEAQDLLSGIAAGADALQRATALMPAMLGAEGPRDYLVLFQNNAEWRSLGGIAGALAVVHTEDGRMSLSQQADSGDFRGDLGVTTPLSPELVNVYSERPTRYVQNVTLLPDFTVGAPIVRDMWRTEFGQEVNGVIAVDPVSLSYLLEATGPVTLPTGDVLTSENAVSFLLNEVYLRYENPADQDAFFAAATAEVFDALASGSADPARLIDALTRSGQERRLYVWNADPAEQELLTGSTLQGTLPETDDDATRFGVYLNDGTGSKMDYYMDVDTAVGWCTVPVGPREAELTVSLTNNAPADAASLPDYVTGGARYGTPRGVANTVTYLYVPLGAELVDTETTFNGVVDDTGFGGGTHDGYRVLTWGTVLAPGENATVTLRVRTPETPRLEAEVTPGVRPAGVAQLAEGCTPPGE